MVLVPKIKERRLYITRVVHGEQLIMTENDLKKTRGNYAGMTMAD